MGLKEILAAKKAAAEKEANEAKTTQEVFVAQASTESTSVPVQASVAPSANEVLVDANGKPLSGFALVKRRKELAAQQAQGVVKEIKVSSIGVGQMAYEEVPEVEEVQKPVEEPVIAVVPDDIPDFSHEAYLAATPESKQAYSDLKMRIDGLISLQDTDLKNAMTELKKALMQNTNAVALMLPSDIGQMVIALRKMTGVELAKAEEKKTGKKAGKVKEPILSAEALEAAFQEL